MRFCVCMPDPEEREALCRELRTWMKRTCASAEIEVWPPADTGEPGICFWDLDGGEPAPLPWDGERGALFVCSADPGRAIASYALHPTGFLQKPIRPQELRRVLDRCVKLWWGSLDRLELLRDRVRVQIPYYNLLWVEGARRGCLIHCVQESILDQEPLCKLEERLPGSVFIRCQRSFLVNLCHVRGVDGGSVRLSDGTELPLGRGCREEVLAAWQSFWGRGEN